MKNLVCPVTFEFIDKPTSRLAAALTAAALVAYVATGLWPILVVVFADYVMRVFTSRRAPSALMVAGVLRALRAEQKSMVLPFYQRRGTVPRIRST